MGRQKSVRVTFHNSPRILIGISINFVVVVLIVFDEVCLLFWTRETRYLRRKRLCIYNTIHMSPTWTAWTTSIRRTYCAKRCLHPRALLKHAKTKLESLYSWNHQEKRIVVFLIYNNNNKKVCAVHPGRSLRYDPFLCLLLSTRASFVLKRESEREIQGIVMF